MNKTVVIIVTLLTTVSLAEAAPAALKAGESFARARRQLYAMGWRADPLAHLSSGEHTGLERQLVENGYLEVESCSEGRSFCILQYTKGEKCLRLQTQGEEIRLMKVDRWSNECRERGINEKENSPPADVRYLIQWRGDCELAGECDRTDHFLLTLKKKYAHDPVIMQILDSRD